MYTFDMDWIGTTKIGCNKYENIPHKECINAFHSVPAYIQNSCVMCNHYKHLSFCLFMLSCKWWNDWVRCHTWTIF